jgi:outer membrane receptor protein involved in Fe transport
MMHTTRPPLHSWIRFSFAAALVLASLSASPARADARSEAKRHFRDGMAMIASGQIERGIAELKEAYAIKPHADLLYNIARAYVDLGRIPEALDYFQRYVATDPDDRAQVEAVMGRLSAAIGARPAQPPPSAAPAQPVDTARLLAALQELIERNKAPAQPATAKNVPARSPAPAPAAKPKEEEGMFEATEVTARTRATAQEIASALDGGRTDEDIFEEQVVTAGVHASSEAKAPASLTVITADEIRLTGAATVPEILRRVPGVDVAEMNPSDTNVSIRGFNRRLSNKVLVLVDGRSVYQDFLGATLWPLLDVSVQDIARIEVIRGPGSALYGANAFAGVVNIITRTGDEVNGGRAFVQTGNYGAVQGAISAGGRNGKLTYRTTLAYDHADKWTAEAPPGFSSQFAQPSRSREIERAEIATDYQSSGLVVRAGAGFDNMNAMEVFPLGSLRTFGNEGQGGFARAEASYGETNVKVYWNALRMRSGPEYWPTALPPIFASIRADVIDASARSGVEYKLLGRHRFNFGAGFRYSTADWGFLAARPDGTTRYTQEHFSGFLQDEWEPTRRVSVSLSYRVDRHPLLADQHITAGGLVHSPRGTVLVEVARDQFVRFTAGTAFRAPTFLESYANLYAPVLPTAGIRFQGDLNLKPEEMLQAELGYKGRIGDRLTPEAVVYVERVQNLITDGALQPAPPGTSAAGQTVLGLTGFQNEPNRFVGVGAELGLRYQPADGIDVAVNYSLEKIADCTSSCTSDHAVANQSSATVANTAQHKLNVVATWRTRANFDLGLDAHYVSSVAWFEKSFDASAPAGVVLAPYALPSYTLVNARVGYRFIRDRLEGGVSVYNLLGDDHREHPFGSPIGRRILVTAAASF